jgi:hypothetical protein
VGRAEIVREPRSDEVTAERATELGACFKSYIYFVDNYCKIYDSVDSSWIRFKLWDSQKAVLHSIHNNQLTVILKARQLGISWLALSYALWQVVFRPIAAVSIFSRRETEAKYMIGQERLRGMFLNLPPWMRSGITTTVDSGTEWTLTNHSSVKAFPTSAGDGYVSTLAIVDEADLSPDLNQLMRSVKPTIDNGGKMVLLSRVNKSEPESEFKQVYRGARAGENGWNHVFLPWSAHPVRDLDWYNRQKKDILSRTGSLDDLYEQYPATPEQALSSRTLDKRIPPIWLEACFVELKPVRAKGGPSLSNLDIYFTPQPGARYVIGADPAEGNPNSDDSSLTVLEMEYGEEVATMAGKFEPAVFAHYIALVSTYYNNAPTLVERNNHGHSVIMWLEEHARRVRLLLGHDAEIHKEDKKTRRKRRSMKAGWLSSTLGKAILYTGCTEFFRTNADFDSDGENRRIVLHNRETYNQLCEIEAATLSAPEGMHDDRADSFALAVVGKLQIDGKAHGTALLMAKTKGW